MADLPNNRAVAHIDLDSFFVSVECLRDTRLKGLPLIIGGNSDRAVVSSCSYEARRFGVHSAMPVKLAKRLCPDALVIQGDMELYSRYSQLVTDVVRDSVPLYEKASIDEFYLDLSGMDRYFGTWRWMVELKDKIVRETGLPNTFALSVNKTVSKIGTGEAKPNGQLQVPFGTERSFLSPLSIRKIPMIGDKTYTTLCSMGIRRIETLQQMPVRAMEQVMGKHGILIWNKANGIDNSPVEPYHEQKSISTEHTFETDTIDVVKLRELLAAMSEKLAYKLRRKNRLCGCIAVKIRYADFDTVTKQLKIPYTANDKTILQTVQQLFKQSYQRRLRIRLIGVRLSDLVQGSLQISLFDDTPEIINLYQAMDRIRNRYGATAVQRAITLGVDFREYQSE
jgi:DNA polymerase-4